MTKKEITSLIILIGVIAFGTYHYLNRTYSMEKSRFQMDTIVKISATAKSKDVGQKIDKVFDYIGTLERNLTEYNKESWLYQINHSQETRFAMLPDAYPLFALSDSLYRMTGGSFDITVKPVFDLWMFDTSTPRLPDSLLIKKTLKFVGYNQVRFDHKYLYKPVGVQFTFGALAKGYILDKAHAYMLSLGLNKGYIDCHSSMTFFGNKLLPEIVGIQHPRKMNDIIATLKVENNSIGTSGDYQQYFDLNGRRYHHILDAHTGMPNDSVYSVTVLNPSALLADGLSTAFFLMSPEQVITTCQKLPNTDAIIYFSRNGSIVSLKSQGIRHILQNEKG